MRRLLGLARNHFNNQFGVNSGGNQYLKCFGTKRPRCRFGR